LDSFVELNVLLERLPGMGLLSFMSRLRAREAYESPEQTASPTSGDLGQKEAKNEAQSEEQLRHMAGGPKAKTAQQKKARRRPR
jgi:hypothetical protein